MAATGLVSRSDTCSGLRPVQLRRDLADIADLIERCFAPTLDASGRLAIREMRVLSRTGLLVWVLGRLSSVVPGLTKGFVWIEQGRLVGNVSVSPAGYENGWIIANVAVEPDFRRRGIARQLMQAALDLIAENGAFAILQVEADNAPACRLYKSLGFRELRTFTRWRRGLYHRLPPPLPGPPMRRVARHEYDRLYALAQSTRPNERGGLGWLRPTTPGALHPSWAGTLKRALTGSRIDYWGIPGLASELDGALIIETRADCLTALVDVLVRPERQGELEALLINSATRYLSARNRPLVIEHPADDPVAVDVFRQYDFRPERTLTHMLWAAPRKTASPARAVPLRNGEEHDP
jgi:ribosomal protein S18 acetylase RimI-like enzyme